MSFFDGLMKAAAKSIEAGIGGRPVQPSMNPYMDMTLIPTSSNPALTMP
jgi:hypothetical protein